MTRPSSKSIKALSAIYQVCIPKTFRDFFDYRAEGFLPSIGARVWVPFGKKKRVGVIIGTAQHSQVPNNKLKSIERIIDNEPLLCVSTLALCKWVSQYYQSPLSEILALALPKNYRMGKSTELPKEIYYQLIMPAQQAHALVPKQARRLHELINQMNQIQQSDLKQTTFSSTETETSTNLADNSDHSLWINKKSLIEKKFSLSQINKLCDLDILKIQEKIASPKQSAREKSSGKLLNAEQLAAVKAISQYWGHYHSFLIYGVTGSGKTEVYAELIKQVLSQKKQALLLVPEIGLTPQLVARFASYFNCPIRVIHSNLTENERQLAWQEAKQNLISLVIGTRTAIFTPMPELALIIIDEEHDCSFKQQEGVRYSARDTALIRARTLKIPIVLGSATPSLESLNNCIQKKYSLLKLHFKALNQNLLHYHLIDLRNSRMRHGLTNQTIQKIKEHLEQENQVLVFINRRGYSPSLLCHACGWSARCPGCDKPFTYHRSTERLLCHHCNFIKKAVTTCKECQSSQLVPLGLGTQRVEEYLKEYFPTKEILRIDRDGVQKKQAFDEALEKIQSQKVQLMVGTQMLAKGHHFPRLTLVVVLDADTGFYSQDFRALERLGQLITQVGGRAGRAEYSGEVIIQTYLPEHPLLKELIQKGYDPFAKKLLTLRAEAQLPPYSFLALIRAQHREEKKVKAFLEIIKKTISLHNLEVFGPAFAPMPRKGNQYRLQLLIRSHSRTTLQHAITQLRLSLSPNKLQNSIRWNIDIDPIDLS